MDDSANENVKHYLAKWFFPHKSFNLESTLLGITSTRNLNSFEISKFNINNINLPINVLIGYHLEQNYEKFNSKSYFSLNTTYVKLDKNDYLVSYGNPSDFSFGIIDYYIQIENKIYCVIYKVEIIQNNFDFDCENFHNMFQANGNLSNIFFKGKILSEKTIIHSKSLISKFISINSMSTNVISQNKTTHSIIKNSIYFSEFISKSDHN